MSRRLLFTALLAAITVSAAHADICLRNDGHAFEAKVVSQNNKEIVIIPDHSDATATETASPSLVTRVITTDDHGALLTDSAPPTTRPSDKNLLPDDPPAPPIAPAPKGPSYYVIPLHGEVGETILASALEKSLEDALKRKPTVVVLDIDSPGGLVAESKKIIALLHRYNKKLRIVALINQDLSAAAVFSLSVKEIYVKSSATIGAATSYIPSNLLLPPKLEEKMQSAWRATARNSAEEGDHDPLLADAMIDSDLDLHWESVNGKPVVKEGSGEHMISRKGKILTLTSREAIKCGLAQGEADDLAELLQALKLDNPTEIKGLAGPLADSLPKRLEIYKKHMDNCLNRFRQDIAAAEKADPAQATTVTRVVNVPAAPMVPQPGVSPYIRQPGVPPYVRQPGVPYAPSTPYVPAPPARRVVTQTQARPPIMWKPDSLDCVVALQQTEIDLQDMITIANAFGRSSEADFLKDILTKISALRATTYDERNKNLDQILPPGTLQTGLAGSHDGEYYTTTSRNFTPVVGFRYTTLLIRNQEVISTFEPVYERPPANVRQHQGDAFAKEDYIVGGITVSANTRNVLAVKVTFVAYKNGRIDPSDSYTSDWLGTPDDSKTTTFPSKSETVLGIRGTKNGTLTGLGLIYRPTPTTK